MWASAASSRSRAESIFFSMDIPPDTPHPSATAPAHCFTPSAGRPRPERKIARAELQAEIGCTHARIVEQRAAAAAHGDAAGLHHIGAIGNGKRPVGVLLHQQN